MLTDSEMEFLEEAIENSSIIEFDYTKKNGESTHRRKGEPYEIKGGTYLYVWDLTRDAIRSFLLDGVSDLEVMEDTFSPRFSALELERISATL